MRCSGPEKRNIAEGGVFGQDQFLDWNISPKVQVIVTPRIPALDVHRWRNDLSQVGHGYRLDLETFGCGWLDLSQLRQVREDGRKYFESPALIGCALAVARDLYERLWGFDPHMRMWGVEDLDFGLKCWLMGHRILHDPEATIGHRFRCAFDSYPVPPECVLINQLRMARKAFTQSVWEEWVEGCRRRHSEGLADHPEGLWAHAWKQFDEDRPSVEQDRGYLQANRPRDEFWYADRFGLDWPSFGTAGGERPRGRRRYVARQLAASPSPPPDGCDCSAYEDALQDAEDALTTAESTLAAAEAHVAQKQADVDQAQSDVDAAASHLGEKEADVTAKQSFKNNLDLDAAATKSALDQAEQDKETTEDNLEDAMNDLDAADQDVQAADAAYQGAKTAAEAANAALQNAHNAYEQAVQNLNNGTGTQAQVDAAEAAGIAAAQDAKNKADALQLKANDKVSKTEILEQKIATAESAAESDIQAGQQVEQAKSANDQKEADAEAAEADLQAAEQARDDAHDDLQNKRQVLRSAKDALKQAKKDASGPKGDKERAEFDRDQAQAQLDTCEQSPDCDGGDREDPPAVDCTAFQQAVAAALAAAEAAYQAAKTAADQAADDLTDAKIALTVAQGNYDAAKAAYSAALAAQRTAADDLKAKLAAGALGTAALLLAQRALVVAIATQVIALAAAIASWGILSGAAVAAGINLALAIAAEAAALAAYAALMTAVRNSAVAVHNAKTNVATTKGNRDAAFNAWEQAKTDLANQRAATAAARGFRDAAEAARDAKEDDLRDAEVALEDCLKRKAAMEK